MRQALRGKKANRAAREVATGAPLTRSRRRALDNLLDGAEAWLLKRGIGPLARSSCLRTFAQVAVRKRQSIKKWSEQTWREALASPSIKHGRQWAIALAFHRYKKNFAPWLHQHYSRNHSSYLLAIKFFPKNAVDALCQQIIGKLHSIGYANNNSMRKGMTGNICEIILEAGKCSLRSFTPERINSLKKHGKRHLRVKLGHMLSVALCELGVLAEPIYLSTQGGPDVSTYRAANSVDPEWTAWIDRWCQTTTKEETTIRSAYSALMTAGRWLKFSHPKANSPAHWTRGIAAEYVRAVHDMKVGDFMERLPINVKARVGKPLAPGSKEFKLSALRCYFRDLEDWGWVKFGFNPDRILRSSITIRSQIGPDPRPIDDAIWAKLIWAGLKLSRDDVSKWRQYKYPFEYVKAVALVWLFSGLRGSEIRRLPVNCVKRDAAALSVDLIADRIKQRPTVCMLRVPVNKTGNSYEKPVDSVLADAIDDWLRVRPAQSSRIDRKTRLPVDFLFVHRAKQVGEGFINTSIIPLLCTLAGVPQSDSIGSITSHRARATMATHLANAKEPLTLYELAAWLGHRSVKSTMHYVATSLTQLTTAFQDADYFRRNIRTIEVLLDRGIVRDGTSSTESPYKYYNLGAVGYCANEFWAQCQHRMACIKCPFHVPKDDARFPLMEARGDLIRMLEQVALTESEEQALKSDIVQLDAALEKLPAAGHSPAKTEPVTKRSGRKRKHPKHKAGHRGG